MDRAMRTHSIEVNQTGNWIQRQALAIQGKNLIIDGRFLRIASIHDEAWLETELDDPEACLKILRGPERLSADIFTFSQKLPGAPARYSYPIEWESLAVVRVTSFDEWWKQLPQETRKNVRRSQRRGVDVIVREFDDQLIRGIIDINNESPVCQGRPSRYYGKSFEEVRKDHCAFLDRSDFICAYCGDEMIGLLKLVHRGNVTSILGYLSKASHHDKRPANALMARAMELCAAKGVSYLVYGNFNYGNKGDSSLREFKIRNGFTEFLVPRYYIPLNFMGRVCMKAKLHRGLLGILPHRLIVTLVKARSKWYNNFYRFSSPQRRIGARTGE